MKKKNVKKLSLNKNAVSKLDEVSGGLQAAAGTNVGSGCPVCPAQVTDTCITDCFATCFLTCKRTCFPCW